MTFADWPTTFDVFIENDVARIQFSFPTDASGVTRSEYDTSPAVDNGPNGKTPATFFLRFYNFQSGAFTDGPIRLGTVGGNSLWLVYEVTPAVGSRFVKKIQYTIWEGPGSEPGAPFEAVKRG